MPNIVLARIDDRLIHGQVMTAWVKYTNATKIYVVDDTVAKDPFLKKVLMMSAPADLEVKVFDLDEAYEGIQQFSKPEDRIIILVKTPEVLEKIINDGLGINEIIIGGMGAKAGRKRLHKNISISEEERKTLEGLMQRGIKVVIRILPDDRAIPMEKV